MDKGYWIIADDGRIKAGAFKGGNGRMVWKGPSALTPPPSTPEYFPLFQTQWCKDVGE